MNKQELIKKYEIKGEQLKEFPVVAIGDVLKNLRELDEREKVKIPQFVADWIKVAKSVYSLSGAMVYGSPGVNKWLENWDNQDLFARAWLDGYEVEKEKRYRVRVKGMKYINGCLAYNKKFGTWYFGTSGNFKDHHTNHARKELEEAGFGWVFDCPGIEIEEVEE